MSESTRGYGIERQFEVYSAGVRGVKPAIPISYRELEARAREILSPEAFDWSSWRRPAISRSKGAGRMLNSPSEAASTESA